MTIELKHSGDPARFTLSTIINKVIKSVMKRICIILLTYSLLLWNCEKDESIKLKSNLIGLDFSHNIINYSIDENRYHILNNLETNTVPNSCTSLSGDKYTIFHLIDDSKYHLTTININSGLIENDVEFDNIIYGTEFSKETNYAYGLFSPELINFSFCKINISTGEIEPFPNINVWKVFGNVNQSTIIEKSNLYVVLANQGNVVVMVIDYISGEVVHEIPITSIDLKLYTIYSIEYNVNDNHLYLLTKNYNSKFNLIKFNLSDKKFEIVIDDLDIKLDIANTAIDNHNNYYILQNISMGNSIITVIDLKKYEIEKEIKEFNIKFGLEAYSN